MIDMGERFQLVPGSNKDYPPIVLFYPVLDEQELVMRTTMIALDELEYPKDRYRVIAIPNSNDLATVASLKTLQTEFPFLELVEVPPTDHPSWQPVWDAWNCNPKAYWWHHGENAYNKDLPPKKTRQVVYAFYNWMTTNPEEGTLMSYTDADSCPPKDHFLAAAIGSRKYRVMQAKNVAGNAGLTWPSTFCAFDHMAWDGSKYEHLSGDPSQPYWMLGKGLFFHAQDIYDLGGFHPWITIEDPEVGLRLWKNGKNLGIMEGSLIEEAPTTFANAILQRKRWIAGFFQTLEVQRRSHGPHGLLIHREDQGLADLPAVPDDVVQLLRLSVVGVGGRDMVQRHFHPAAVVHLLGRREPGLQCLLHDEAVLVHLVPDETDHGHDMAADPLHASRQPDLPRPVVDVLGDSAVDRLPHVPPEPGAGVGAHGEEGR